ncbi:MAG: hypothetical protein J6W28_02645 [Clostridia bacterium]|nr:hypothetical protein [Clostridia bacterium]
MKKVAIVYGEMKNDLQKRAVEEMTKILLDCTVAYPVCAPYGEPLDAEAYKFVYIGTKANNPHIRETSKTELTVPESYAITVADDTVTVEGFDDAGVLYGVLDFYNKYIVKNEKPTVPEHLGQLFTEETLPGFFCTSAPTVKERGLWTWGHVIYDYRDYLHNMMLLKMNGVIIWNDFVPANVEEIVAYAHSCNIKVYWGFSWLWGVDCSKKDLNNLVGEPEKIFAKYEKEYASASGDGIYFQTFTELKTDNIDGVLVAEAATKFVNETSALFYEKYPNIEIQFGLHATSVKDKLSFLRAVDPRIRIVWEDCGAMPFAYSPVDLREYDATGELVSKIANLRGEDDRFGVVTKAFVTLDWPHFVHLTGSQCIGVSSKAMKHNRVDRKSRAWRFSQAGWLINADKAQDMIVEMCRLKKGDFSSFALVEDGMFEENIPYPVALYAEMLWNATADVKQLTYDVALRSYVSFA